MPTTAQPIEVVGRTAVASAHPGTSKGTMGSGAILYNGPQDRSWYSAEQSGRNARWLNAHPEALVPFRGQWVAVFDERIVSTAASFETLHAYLTEAKIVNALVSYAPEDDRWDYLIG